MPAMRIVYPKFHVTHFPDDIFIIDQVLWPVFDNPTEEEQNQTDTLSTQAGMIASDIVLASYVPIQPIRDSDGEFQLFAVTKDTPVMRFSSTLQITENARLAISIIDGPCFDLGRIKIGSATVH